MTRTGERCLSEEFSGRHSCHLAFSYPFAAEPDTLELQSGSRVSGLTSDLYS